MALLEVRQLTKTFGGLVANDRIDLSVDAGRVVGVIGPNGSGKTTLFNCISGFHAVSSGAVLLDGRTISGLGPHQICRLGLARTFQIAEVFARMTVIENAMVGAFNRDRRLGPGRERAMEALRRVGLSAKAEEPSKGLSPPERRRLSFAMALATEPKMLLLDEAMAGLLPNEISELLDLILEIRGAGISVLVIEHVIDAIMRVADRITVLEAGQVIASGPPDAIAVDERVIRAYLGDGYRRDA